MVAVAEHAPRERGRLKPVLQRYASIITGACSNPQPSGRYITAADVIAMHNRSLGKCPCGRDIFLLWDPAWDDDPENAPHSIHNKAEVQRLDNTVMHLVSNCTDSLVCSVCQAMTRANANYLQKEP